MANDAVEEAKKKRKADLEKYKSREKGEIKAQQDRLANYKKNKLQSKSKLKPLINI